MRIISEEGVKVKKGNKPWSIYPHWDANDYDENVAIKAEKTYLNKKKPTFTQKVTWYPSLKLLLNRHTHTVNSYRNQRIIFLFLWLYYETARCVLLHNTEIRCQALKNDTFSDIMHNILSLSLYVPCAPMSLPLCPCYSCICLCAVSDCP